MKSIIIIGCGNIGFRHLQSIIKSKKNYNIFVIEKDIIQLNKLKRYIKKKNKLVKFFNNLDHLDCKVFDLAIFCTNSDIRFLLLKIFLKNNKIKFIIFEKIAFQSNHQFKIVNNLLKKKKIVAWVNCPRRYYSFFKSIKKKYYYNKFFKLEFCSKKWNMGSNAIHFIDLFRFYCSSRLFINQVNLYKKIYKSKRKNFLDFYGSILLTTNKNEFFYIENKILTKNNYLKLIFDEIQILIELNKNNVTITKNSKIIKKQKFFQTHQSDITLNLIKQIEKNGECDLVRLSNSFHDHKILFTIFNKHIYKLKKKKIINCPIT